MITYRNGKAINIGDVVYWASNIRFAPQACKGRIVKIVERDTSLYKKSYVSIMPEGQTTNPIPIYNFLNLIKHE